MRPRPTLLISLLAMALLALAGAGAASANSTNSSNWAGYAAHRSGVKFTRVIGAWTQPSATCTSGRRTYSAVWVGLGGYSRSSPALEQIGTEIDCNRAGQVVSTAWFELVPAPSRPISMTVSPGDQIAASVSVNGHTVTLALADVTAHQTFQRTLHARSVDVSSADWIVEAPSDCVSATSCQTLPLANFGSATIGLAEAKTTGGHVGSIGDPAWGATRIRLTPGTRHLVSVDRGSGSAGTATPSALSVKGSSFKVVFSNGSGSGTPQVATSRAAPRAGQLVHPGLF
jgi:hypothetical protein